MIQSTFMCAIEHTALELKLPAHCDTYCLQCAAQPATPHVEVFNMQDPARIAAGMRAPFFKLAPEDIALLPRATRRGASAMWSW
jgi:hypothetical protein